MLDPLTERRMVICLEDVIGTQNYDGHVELLKHSAHRAGLKLLGCDFQLLSGVL